VSWRRDPLSASINLTRWREYLTEEPLVDLENEFSEVFVRVHRNALVARSIQELARDRRTIAFCVTVNHARNLCRSLNALGVPAGIVHGDLPREQRARALARSVWRRFSPGDRESPRRGYLDPHRHS